MVRDAPAMCRVAEFRLCAVRTGGSSDLCTGLELNSGLVWVNDRIDDRAPLSPVKSSHGVTERLYNLAI
jgi:hypothetical protein